MGNLSEKERRRSARIDSLMQAGFNEQGNDFVMGDIVVTQADVDNDDDTEFQAKMDGKNQEKK